MLKVSDLPNRFRLMYQSQWNWWGKVQLLALGAVKTSSNPYFAITEKNVENQIVRWFGKWPESEYGILHVERADGSSWSISLNHFESFERIDKVDPEKTSLDMEDLLRRYDS
jgi:hypothetical protein